MMLFWQPLTVRSMAVDAVSNDPDIGRASDWPAPLAQEATPPTLSVCIRRATRSPPR
jgi:hypothetical protein